MKVEKQYDKSLAEVTSKFKEAQEALSAVAANSGLFKEKLKKIRNLQAQISTIQNDIKSKMDDEQLIIFLKENYRFSKDFTGKFLTIDELHAQVKDATGKSYLLNALVKVVHQHFGVQRKKEKVYGKEKRVWYLKAN